MENDLSKIIIKEGIFNEEVKLELFPETKNGKKSRISLIYGKNGSGKSTIARAIKNRKTSDIKFLSLDNTVLDYLSDNSNEEIYVFNEEYIEQNIKLKDSGLETIIMLGEEVDLDNKIASLNKEVSELNEKYEIIQEIIKKYDDLQSMDNPKNIMTKMIESLKGDRSWAGRDKSIKGNRKNSSVTTMTVKEIANLNVSRSSKKVEEIFEEKRNKYNKLNLNKKIITNIISIKYSYDEEKIINTLNEKIENPKLTEREKYILRIIQNGNQRHFEKVLRSFDEEKLEKCPYCLQKVERNYRESLIDSIKKILNKEVDKHKEKLLNLKKEKILIDLNEYNVVNTEIVEDINSEILEVNKIIEFYNESIDKKYNNVYIPICIENKNIKNRLIEINLKINYLNKKKEEYNIEIENKNKIKDELIMLNKELAYFILKEDYKQYLRLCKNREFEESRKISLKNKIIKIKKHLDELNQKKKNIRLAVDHINRGLSYVFFNKDRFKIEVINGEYVLISNGNNVKPSDISCGERNIIALCYFFTNIMNNRDERDLYKQKILLVIDDPVSSFDMENKIGILSFLKYQIQAIISGNNKSKVIVLSHDLSTICDLKKVSDEISNVTENNEKCNVYELKNKNIEKINTDKYNQYSKLINIIYDYGYNTPGSQEYGIFIGNTMRRVLEAFSTFEYRIGIDKISYDRDILNNIDNENCRLYFEGLMYRLILNGESHSKYKIDNMKDYDFFEVISEEEKRKTARDILSFIYLLNPLHLKSQFNDNKGKKIDEVKKWCREIENI